MIYTFVWNDDTPKIKPHIFFFFYVSLNSFNFYFFVYFCVRNFAVDWYFSYCAMICFVFSSFILRLLYIHFIHVHDILAITITKRGEISEGTFQYNRIRRQSNGRREKILQKERCYFMYYEKVSISCSTLYTRRVTHKKREINLKQ